MVLSFSYGFKFLLLVTVLKWKRAVKWKRPKMKKKKRRKKEREGR